MERNNSHDEIETLRLLGVQGTNVQLNQLLRKHDYSMQNALNDYYDNGFSPVKKEASRKERAHDLMDSKNLPEKENYAGFVSPMVNEKRPRSFSIESTRTPTIVNVISAKSTPQKTDDKSLSAEIISLINGSDDEEKHDRQRRAQSILHPSVKRAKQEAAEAINENTTTPSKKGEKAFSESSTWKSLGQIMIEARSYVTGRIPLAGSKLNVGIQQEGGTLSASKRSHRKRAPIVRVRTDTGREVARLEKEGEAFLGRLIDAGLLYLEGMCIWCPDNLEIFSVLNLELTIFLRREAFAIFSSSHQLHYLAHDLYRLLECVDEGTIVSQLQRGHETLLGQQQDEDEHKIDAQDLNGLYASCSGMDIDANNSVIQQVESYFHEITLRNYQKQALVWMLDRENLDKAADIDETKLVGEDVDQRTRSNRIKFNPLWDKKAFYQQHGSCDKEDEHAYYINKYQRVASLRPPPPPTPCLGGILADDMGMGKTITVLSLILAQKYQVEVHGVHSVDDVNASTSNDCSLQGKSLVVCPMSMLSQWQSELTKRIRNGKLTVHVHYGGQRGAKPLGEDDVVITTYGVVAAEYTKLESLSQSKSSNTLLHKMHWNRIILDEAHFIKSQSTMNFNACRALSATHRWCITGTPIQNSLDDLQALIAFLRYEPWSFGMWWHRVISDPYKSGDPKAIARLKSVLFPILLRRTKESKDSDGKRIIQLPRKTSQTISLQFTAAERKFYQALFQKSQAEFSGYVRNGTTNTNYIAMLSLLLRMRQACNHPYLVLGRECEVFKAKKQTVARLDGESDDAFFDRMCKQFQVQEEPDATAMSTPTGTITSSAIDSSAESAPTVSYLRHIITEIQKEGLEAQECPICLDAPEDAVLTPCAHLLCRSCVVPQLQGIGCPVCRRPTKENELMSVFSSTDSNDAAVDHPTSVSSLRNDIVLSTKLNQLLLDVDDIIRADEKTGEFTKVVVFSQWTHMLDIVGSALTSRGISCGQFDGSMSQVKRQQMLTKFQSVEGGMRVLAISLKAGGVGLNLTSASRVIMLDPWWNPATEDQAVDRVHRLGQTRPVHIRKYVIQDTVEDMILRLQERKADLAQNVLSLGSRNKDEGKLRIDDLIAFFS